MGIPSFVLKKKTNSTSFEQQMSILCILFLTIFFFIATRPWKVFQSHVDPARGLLLRINLDFQLGHPLTIHLTAFWKDSVVILTGASEGIGADLAVLLSSLGAKLVTISSVLSTLTFSPS